MELKDKAKVKDPLKEKGNRLKVKVIVLLNQVFRVPIWYATFVICMVIYLKNVISVRHCTTLRLTNKLGVNLIYDSSYLMIS